MSEQAELSDKEKLELEQIRLTNEKLKQETKPEKWWSKAAKFIGAFVGIVTVLATLIGIWESYDKTITDRENARMADQRTQIDKAIERLESPSTTSKLIGLSVLSGYLRPNSSESPTIFSRLYCILAPSGCVRSNNSDVKRQILFTLASLMGAEKDTQIQATVTDLIASLPRDGVIALEQWEDFQKQLVRANLALTTKGDLVRHRHFAAASPTSNEENIARALGKIIAINARNGRVPTYFNYRGIYCGECDFRGAIFPERADFTGAVLDNADFSRATLRSVIFDDAQIAGTKFTEADLRVAKFRILRRSVDGADNPDIRTAYLDHIASALDLNATVDIRMPNFSCANLDGADFGRHALFPGVFEASRSYSTKDQATPGWYQAMPRGIKDRAQPGAPAVFQPVQVLPPKFFRASLKNTYLRETGFFFVTGKKVPDDFFFHHEGGVTSDGAVPVAEFDLWQGDIGDTAFKILTDKDLDSNVGNFQRTLRASFFSAEFDNASLSPMVKNFLKQQKPTDDDYKYGFYPSDLSKDDADSSCTTRRN